MDPAIQLYDSIYSWKNYEKESKEIATLIKNHSPHASSLLEMACGTGRHLEYLQSFECTGIDICSTSLGIAQKRNPHATFLVGDMQEVRVESLYDVILCLFGGISYIVPERLPKLINKWKHYVRPGGVFIIEPWIEESLIDFGTPFLQHAKEESFEAVRMVTPYKDVDCCVLDFHFISSVGHGITTFNQENRLYIQSHESIKSIFYEEGCPLLFEGKGFLGGSVLWCFGT